GLLRGAPKRLSDQISIIDLEDLWITRPGPYRRGRALFLAHSRTERRGRATHRVVRSEPKRERCGKCFSQTRRDSLGAYHERCIICGRFKASTSGETSNGPLSARQDEVLSASHGCDCSYPLLRGLCRFKNVTLPSNTSAQQGRSD